MPIAEHVRQASGPVEVGLQELGANADSVLGPVPGAYALLLRLPGRTTWRRPGHCQELPRGWYVYTGSARGGLQGRLRRHLRTTSVRHWHVDTLLASGRIVDIQAIPCREADAECRLADQVSCWPGAVAVSDFGASDCGCRTHLYAFERRPGGSLRAGPVRAALETVFEGLGRRYEDDTLLPRDPFRTLVTCVLSLRTQEPVTLAAADRLFAVISDPDDLAHASAQRLADIVYPVGMYRRKAKQLIQMSRHIIDRFGGRTPASVESLLSLPGVGRKTANLVLSFALDRPAVCVDTHVHRICNRWGLVRTHEADATEAELRRLLPRHLWSCTNPYLVQHGRTVCRPGRPRCERCFLRAICGYEALRTERLLFAGSRLAHPCLGSRLAAPADASQPHHSRLHQ